MKKSFNFINAALSIIITAGLIFVGVYIGNRRYSNVDFFKSILLFVVGAIISGFISTLLHELGHVLFGKINGFKCMSLTVWFFKWYKTERGISFDLVGLGDAGGSSELIAVKTDNLSKRLIRATLGALFFSFLSALIGLIAIFVKTLPIWSYCLIVMFLPMGMYGFLENSLPMINEGAKNDGALVLGLKRQDDDSKVVLSLIKIQSELFAGKKPSEIDEKLYFDLPQLPEDNLNFIMLLDARYAYYLDKEDFVNAKKTSDRLLSLEDYIPKVMMNSIKADALYDYCTFDFNEEKADDLMYELEKFLNYSDTPQSIRVRTAYIVFVKGEKDKLDIFYKRGVKLAKKLQIKGLSRYEIDLFDRLKA